MIRIRGNMGTATIGKLAKLIIFLTRIRKKSTLNVGWKAQLSLLQLGAP
jgi:hypothetical protein